MLTSHDLMRELGIKHVRTLMRWADLRLIPNPKMDVHPNGRGRIAYWPSWVLSHGRRIRKMLDDGCTRQEINKTFGSDWKKIEKLYSRYEFLSDFERNERDKTAHDLAEQVERKVRLELTAMMEVVTDRAFGISIENAINDARILIQEGYRPVMVIAAKFLKIAPDFVVGAWISRFGHLENSVYVCQLLPIFAKAENDYFKPHREVARRKPPKQVLVNQDFSYEIQSESKKQTKKTSVRKAAKAPKSRTDD